MSRDATPPRTALALGGNSDIAIATLQRLARDGLQHAVLALRNPDRDTARITAALPGVQLSIVRWDANDPETHRQLVADAAAILGTIDVALCAVGMFTGQDSSARSNHVITSRALPAMPAVAV